MRSYTLWIALSALLTAGVLADDVEITVDAGASYTFSVVTYLHDPVKCHLDGPNGVTIDFNPGEEGPLNDKFVQLKGTSMIECMVTMLDISSNDVGNWKIYYSSNGDEVRTQLYRVLVNEAVSEVTPESTPAVENEDEKHVEDELEPEERRIEMLEEQYIYSSIDRNEIVKVDQVDFVEGQGCSLKTPDGVEHPFSNLNIPGVNILEEHNVECAVIIHVTPENIGEWMLLVQAKRFTVPIEKRLPFTIIVEEIVSPSQEQITITEGNDLYLRLRDSIDAKYFDTCKLTTPADIQSSFDIYPKYNNYCEFIVRNVDKNAAGTWRITFGDTITYNAHIDISVTERLTVSQDNLSWTSHRPINITVGPENAIYCRVSDPSGFVVFDGFGRCQVNLERVTSEHNGYWKMTVGFVGRVVTEEQNFFVFVRNSEPKAVVTTSVRTDKPAVMVSCSVNTTYEVRACKFRSPQGKILIASPGIGEDDYIFHDESVNYQSDLHSHDCGIRMNNPSTSDLGLWRCAIETDEEIYYGFLPVLCPWSLSIPEIAATVVQEPTLTAVMPEMTREEGESVTMSCSVQSAIRYCYFRAQNGTTFSVSPDSSEAYEYVGAGFDAGECGIRFNNMLARDSGRWSCHVGFPDSSQPEQRVNIQVTVEEVLAVSVSWDHHNNLVVEAQVNGRLPLEYCRFVRMDGFGFTSDNLPAEYHSHHVLQHGACGIVIPDPTILDRHPWTVAVMIHGRDVELSQYSDHALHGMVPIEQPITVTRSASLWILVTFICLLIIAMGVLFVPKNNRKCTLSRITIMRSSIRNSIKKQPLTEKPLPIQQV